MPGGGRVKRKAGSRTLQRETVSSPEMICSFIYIDSFSEKEGDWEFSVGKNTLSKGYPDV